jgi:hypothetical protein
MGLTFQNLTLNFVHLVVQQAFIPTIGSIGLHDIMEMLFPVAASLQNQIVPLI